jgi:hypothetical protein
MSVFCNRRAFPCLTLVAILLGACGGGNATELNSEAPGDPVKLNPPLPTGGHMGRWLLSPDLSQVA